MCNIHKKCIVEDITMTLCEIDTSKMYSMHKKCLIVEDTTIMILLCEIHTMSYLYTYIHNTSIHLRCIMCMTSVM